MWSSAKHIQLYMHVRSVSDSDSAADGGANELYVEDDDDECDCQRQQPDPLSKCAYLRSAATKIQSTPEPQGEWPASRSP